MEKQILHFGVSGINIKQTLQILSAAQIDPPRGTPSTLSAGHLALLLYLSLTSWERLTNMPPHNLSSKVWGQWRRLVVKCDDPKKLKYTTSDLSSLNIKLVSANDTDHASWFEPFYRLDKLTLMESESLNKLPTLDLEAGQKLDVPSRQLRHCSVCYGLWYAIQDRIESYADLANFPDPGESLSTIRL